MNALKRAVLMTAFAALIAPAYAPTLKASPAQQADRTAQKPAPVAGELVTATTGELAVRRRDSDVGELVVHFPRIGFQIRRM